MTNQRSVFIPGVTGGEGGGLGQLRRQAPDKHRDRAGGGVVSLGTMDQSEARITNIHQSEVSITWQKW